MCLNGALAGLVAITAGCDVVSPLGAFFIGIIAGFVVVFGVEFLDKVVKIDDPVGAIGRTRLLRSGRHRSYRNIQHQRRRMGRDCRQLQLGGCLRLSGRTDSRRSDCSFLGRRNHAAYFLPA